MRSVHGPRMRDRLFTILQTVVSRRVKQGLKTPTERNPKQNKSCQLFIQWVCLYTESHDARWMMRVVGGGVETAVICVSHRRK